MSNSSIQALRRFPFAALVLVLPLLVSGCGRGDSTGSALPQTKTGKAASSAVTGLDLAGHAIAPFDAADAKAIVFIFISTDCPISNRYAPEIRRVEGDFARSGVRFWLVYADADTSSDAIRKHVKEYRLPQQVLRDPRHTLVRLAQARVTPEAAVFLPGPRLVYHGRIDNRYADLGKERPEATQHDLEEVLKAIVQGKPVPYSTAKAVGCYLPEPK
jgi:AhpC/TSA family